MAVILTGTTDDGKPYPSLSALADDILELDPGAKLRLVKGSTSGVLMSERAAVLYLMQRYTANGNLRKGK